jgi:surface antigen
MPASTPWWSTPSIAAPRPGRRPTLGLAAAIVASVLSGAAMADPPPQAIPSAVSPPVSLPVTSTAWKWIDVAQPRRDVASSLPYAVYPIPYGLDRGTCDRSLLAKELVRGTTGLSTSKSKSRATSVSNVTINPLVGSIVGRSMDDIDQYCVSRVLEYAPDRARIHWYGDPGITYGVTPLSTFERDGRYCREFHTAAQIDGRNERVYSIACRMPDGVWQVMS